MFNVRLQSSSPQYVPQRLIAGAGVLKGTKSKMVSYWRQAGLRLDNSLFHFPYYTVYDIVRSTKHFSYDRKNDESFSRETPSEFP